MSLTKSWNKFWFSPAPYFDLAFLRILFTSLQVFVLLNHSFDKIQYTLTLPPETYLPLPAVKVLLLPFGLGWGAMPDAALMHGVYLATLLTGFLSLVGLLTNISLFVFFLGNVLLQAFIYSFGDSHHPEAIMMIALLALALGPCGKVLSLDYLVFHRHQPAAPTEALLDVGSRFAGWPVRLLQCFFPLMYLSAVTSKLATGGLDWANGYTLQYYLIQDGMRRGSELGMYLSQFHHLILGLQYVVLIFQATFFLVVFYPRLRWIYLPLGLCFHIGIYLTLRAPFPQWIALYAIYIPWSTLFRWLADQRLPAALGGNARASGAITGPT